MQFNSADVVASLADYVLIDWTFFMINLEQSFAENSGYQSIHNKTHITNILFIKQEKRLL